MRLAGKTAIITGAGTGIGRACAELFVREGASVALVARNRERLQQVAQPLGAEHTHIIAQDIATRHAEEMIVRRTLEHFGAVNVLVNSAAALLPGTAESQTEHDWDVQFNTNVRALWLLSAAVLGPMRHVGGGSIVNIASVLGLVGARNRVGYSATKGAVIALTKAMALDCAPDNIRVNAICPGIVDTPLVSDFITKASDPDAALKQRVGLHPLGRFGRAEEIAQLALHLASDESSWTTGAAIPIDGGYTAQ
jgi:NAD(P)-dependent dehydrogenase (short-subunit alcohol dehydrogenase family)